MDWQHIQRHWDHYKKGIKQKWSDLSDGDLQLTQGRRDHLEAAIQKRYGFTIDFVRNEIDAWFRWQLEVPRSEYQQARTIAVPQRKGAPHIETNERE